MFSSNEQFICKLHVQLYVYMVFIIIHLYAASAAAEYMTMYTQGTYWPRYVTNTGLAIKLIQPVLMLQGSLLEQLL